MVRNMYRAVELGEGFDGYLNHHEAYFSVLDASFMVLAPAIFNIFWPPKYVDGIPRYEEVQMKDALNLDPTHLMPESRGAHEQSYAGTGA